MPRAPKDKEFEQHPEIPGSFYCGEAVITQNNKIVGATGAAVLVYLCSRCDKTHVVFQDITNDLDFMLRLQPEHAEMIANALVNPQPINLKH